MVIGATNGAEGSILKAIRREIAAGFWHAWPMGLDHATCYQATSIRDPRGDGRWFIGVHTTGIYCRPICPARTPKRENVTFYATAAAAQAAGFRPC